VTPSTQEVSNTIISDEDESKVATEMKVIRDCPNPKMSANSTGILHVDDPDVVENKVEHVSRW